MLPFRDTAVRSRRQPDVRVTFRTPRQLLAQPHAGVALPSWSFAMTPAPSATRSTEPNASVRIMLSTWEPPIGIEPMTYALRGACALAARALAALIAPIIALMALTALGISGRSVHEPVHARDLASDSRLPYVTTRRALLKPARSSPSPACPLLLGEVPELPLMSSRWSELSAARRANAPPPGSAPARHGRSQRARSRLKAVCGLSFPFGRSWISVRQEPHPPPAG
jgi:hypothetical protein